MLQSPVPVVTGLVVTVEAISKWFNLDSQLDIGNRDINWIMIQFAFTQRPEEADGVLWLANVGLKWQGENSEKAGHARKISSSSQI